MDQETGKPSSGRQPGRSSRLSRAPGKRTPWVSPSGEIVDLPVILDLVMTTADGQESWRVEATIGLRQNSPVVTAVRIECRDPGAPGLDLETLQNEFRWATPLEAVTRLVPLMMRRGVDPFSEEFPFEGYPEVTRTTPPGRLSDEFLEDVARDYLTSGRGYADTMSSRYGVSPRTVVSWIEKARQRGILTETIRGRRGGSVVPPGHRRES